MCDLCGKDTGGTMCNLAENSTKRSDPPKKACYNATPKRIWLLDDYCDGEPCKIWSDDPNPSGEHEAPESTMYVRADLYFALFRKIITRKKKKLITPPEPRYDELFEEGMKWLN